MFDSIKLFILEHWEVLLSVFLCVLSFVLCLIRKKPSLNKLSLYMEELYQKIPVFIDLVEKNGHGVEKKMMVMELAKEFLIDQFGFYDFETISKYISDYIEVVLTTPQKKNKEV